MFVNSSIQASLKFFLPLSVKCYKNILTSIKLAISLFKRFDDDNNSPEGLLYYRIWLFNDLRLL